MHAIAVSILLLIGATEDKPLDELSHSLFAQPRAARAAACLQARSNPEHRRAVPKLATAFRHGRQRPPLSQTARRRHQTRPARPGCHPPPRFERELKSVAPQALRGCLPRLQPASRPPASPRCGPCPARHRRPAGPPPAGPVASFAAAATHTRTNAGAGCVPGRGRGARWGESGAGGPGAEGVDRERAGAGAERRAGPGSCAARSAPGARGAVGSSGGRDGVGGGGREGAAGGAGAGAGAGVGGGRARGRARSGGTGRRGRGEIG